MTHLSKLDHTEIKTATTAFLAKCREGGAVPEPNIPKWLISCDNCGIRFDRETMVIGHMKMKATEEGWILGNFTKCPECAQKGIMK